MKVTYRVHAVTRMFERGITEEEVHRVLSEGDVIAAYPEDQPYPSRLLVGGGRFDRNFRMNLTFSRFPCSSQEISIRILKRGAYSAGPPERCRKPNRGR